MYYYKDPFKYNLIGAATVMLGEGEEGEATGSRERATVVEMVVWHAKREGVAHNILTN